MKRLFFFLTAMLICGAMTAQDHYSYNSYAFEKQMIFRAEIFIDGVSQTSDQIEIGAFDGDVCTCTKRISRASATSSYYRANMTIGGNGTYALTFKLYDHENNVELLDYTLRDPENNVCTEFSWQEGTFGTWKNSYKLYFTTTTTQTFTRTVAGYGTNDGGYVLVSSPIGNVAPADVENMIYTAADEVQFYDLYAFDEAYEYEWRNFKAGSFTTLEAGKGYLYANKNNVDLKFTGTPYNGDGKVVLHKTDGSEFAGWNLVGNPFADTAYIDRPFYVMDADGLRILAEQQTGAIYPMHGVFVTTDTDGEEMTFTTTAPTPKSSMVLNVSDSHGSIIDRAIVNFGEGRQLPKFQFDENSTKIFFEQEGRDFAVVSGEAEGSMPVFFKAEENGRYTLDFKTERTSFAYLHLIDNETGEDIDLIETPTYNFAALTTDPVSRFKIIYAKTTTGVNENFAFISDGQIILNGVDNGANVQVIDPLGRIIANGNGIQTVSTKGLSAGVYVIRLINGNKVHTQKIVVE